MLLKSFETGAIVEYLLSVYTIKCNVQSLEIAREPQTSGTDHIHLEEYNLDENGWLVTPPADHRLSDALVFLVMGQNLVVARSTTRFCPITRKTRASERR
jgi:hypothetical protein